jgi:hypothetical protein
MPFYYCFKGYVFKMVSTRRSKNIGEKEVDRATIGGHEKKGDCEGEVYTKQETFEPCIYLS